MSDYYGLLPINLSGLETTSILGRAGKVKVDNFARQYKPASGLTGLLDSLPRFLAAEDFRSVIAAILRARSEGKPIIWGMGGHVIKCGLAPVLIDLMNHGFATAFAMNGSASIHDFEIGIAGNTSEDVDALLTDGSFGAAEETGRGWNNALVASCGLGESLGMALQNLADPRFHDHCLLFQAWRKKIPVTVHAAIGTDTTHIHPAVDPAVLGSATHKDFLLFAALVEKLNRGGVYINLGSAVILPEVFLKALSLVRNLGKKVEAFTTVDFDFLQQYRPRTNVVQRPHSGQTGAGGQGFAITGHHELMIPLLAACLLDKIRHTGKIFPK